MSLTPPSVRRQQRRAALVLGAALVSTFVNVAPAAAATPAPKLVAGGLIVIDGGDGDGMIEPGETFQILQGVRNTGTATATGVFGRLSESMSTLSLTLNASAYPDVPQSQMRYNMFRYVAKLSPTAPCGTPLTLSLSVTTAQETATVVPISIRTCEEL